MQILAVVVCLLSAFFDGVRDANVVRRAHWWQWHVVKWLSFYPPLILLLVLGGIELWYWIPLAAVSWVVWQIGYRVRLP